MARKAKKAKSWVAGAPLEVQREVGAAWEPATYVKKFSDWKGWHSVELAVSVLIDSRTNYGEVQEAAIADSTLELSSFVFRAKSCSVPTQRIRTATTVVVAEEPDAPPAPARAEKWIGVDLDGTLAHHDRGAGVGSVGAPVPLMVARVRAWLAAGRQVRIVTARACGQAGLVDQREQVAMVRAWCLLHLGQALEVTASKDFDMVELWDDRAHAVQTNTGRVRPHGAWVDD